MEDPTNVVKSKLKRRRSNAAHLMRKRNRNYKRQGRHRLVRTVKKFAPVEAPQVGTYHGAQDDLSVDLGTSPISIKKIKVTETPRIATNNCKGEYRMSGPDKSTHDESARSTYFILARNSHHKC